MFRADGRQDVDDTAGLGIEPRTSPTIVAVTHLFLTMAERDRVSVRLREIRKNRFSSKDTASFEKHPSQQYDISKCPPSFTVGDSNSE